MNVNDASDLLSVLLMDDEACIRETVRMMLESSGFQVDCASDGEDAIRLFTKALHYKKPYDLVLLDLIIKEGKGGIETMVTLKTLYPNVKAILISGSHYHSAMRNPGGYGFCASLKKPYTVLELRETVKKFITHPTT